MQLFFHPPPPGRANPRVQDPLQIPRGAPRRRRRSCAAPGGRPGRPPRAPSARRPRPVRAAPSGSSSTSRRASRSESKTVAPAIRPTSCLVTVDLPEAIPPVRATTMTARGWVRGGDRRGRISPWQTPRAVLSACGNIRSSRECRPRNPPSGSQPSTALARRDVRLADLRIVDRQRTELHGGLGAGDADDVPAEFLDRHLARVADVHRLVEVRLREAENAVDLGRRRSRSSASACRRRRRSAAGR